MWCDRSMKSKCPNSASNKDGAGRDRISLSSLNNNKTRKNYGKVFLNIGKMTVWDCDFLEKSTK